MSRVETRPREAGPAPREASPRRAATPVRIEAGRSRASLREAYAQRELLLFLVRRDLVVRYVQTVLGLGWAVLVPLLTMVVFTVFFGRLADIDSQGVPYALFSLAAIVPWTYFSTSVNAAANSVVANSSLITKVYFPRVFLPLAPLLAGVVDLVIAFVVLCAVIVAFGRVPELAALAIPLLVAVLLATAAGVGMLLAALGSRYRDVRYATPFLLQLLLFVSPVIYSASVVPTPERYLYALNPMVGVLEGFRAGLLGTSAFPWALVGIGAASAAALLALGLRVYGRTARYFADLA